MKDRDSKIRLFSNLRAVLLAAAVSVLLIPAPSRAANTVPRLVAGQEAPENGPEDVEALRGACVELESASGLWSSGVILGSEGQWILTVAHGNRWTGESMNVRLPGRPDERLQATVLRRDEKLDVALLKLDGGPAGTGIAELKRWAPEQPSTDLVAPLWSLGHAGARGRHDSPDVRNGFGFRRHEAEGLLISTCSLQPGDSGGALLDRHGRLLGLNRTMEQGGRFATHVAIDAVLARWPDLADLTGIEVVSGVPEGEFVRVAVAPPKGSVRAMLAARNGSEQKAVSAATANHRLARHALQRHAQNFTM